MKLAVLVYGMYREFDIAVKSWDFLNNIDSDVYFSTWNKSTQKNIRLSINVDEEVTEERIKKHIPNVITSVQSEDNFKELTNPQKLIYHWKNCLKMVKDSGKEYDLIMLTRPDNYKVISEPYERLFKYNKPNTIYGLEKIIFNNNEPFIQDIFFIGNFHVMSNLIETIPHTITAIHQDLSKHILKLGYVVENVEHISMATTRANVRGMKELNIKNVFEKTMEWGDNQEQYKK
jgi:hypothetical protein